MYKYHRDHVYQKWNVFRLVNGREEFIQAFNTKEEAQSYCYIQNGGY